MRALLFLSVPYSKPTNNLAIQHFYYLNTAIGTHAQCSRIFPPITI